jgi:hypothetical protein
VTVRVARMSAATSGAIPAYRCAHAGNLLIRNVTGLTGMMMAVEPRRRQMRPMATGALVGLICIVIGFMIAMLGH